jgi:hypothetical protein
VTRLIQVDPGGGNFRHSSFDESVCDVAGPDAAKTMTTEKNTAAVSFIAYLPRLQLDLTRPIRAPDAIGGRVGRWRGPGFE